MGRIEGTWLDGSARPEVVWVYLCRQNDRMYQMIGHDTETGATCFLETKGEVNTRADGLTVQEGMVHGELPSPDDPEYGDVWKRPYLVAYQRCWSCHTADPFLHTPYITGARMPDDPDEPVVPVVSGPETPYFLVGEAFNRLMSQDDEEHDDLQTLHIEGNACLQCHRFVDPREFGEHFYDVNAYMPPYDPGSLADDYEALLECSEDGPENTPGCTWERVPGSSD